MENSEDDDVQRCDVTLVDERVSRRCDLTLEELSSSLQISEDMGAQVVTRTLDGRTLCTKTDSSSFGSLKGNLEV